MSEPTPPPSEPGTSRDRETLPDLGAVVPRGQAELALSLALDALAQAFERVEALGMAYARAVDGPK